MGSKADKDGLRNSPNIESGCIGCEKCLMGCIACSHSFRDSVNQRTKSYRCFLMRHP